MCHKFYEKFEKMHFGKFPFNGVFPYFIMPAQCAHWAQFRGYDEIECLKGHWNGFKAQIGGFYD